jgi:hypothetical protein
MMVVCFIQKRFCCQTKRNGDRHKIQYADSRLISETSYDYGATNRQSEKPFGTTSVKVVHYCNRMSSRLASLLKRFQARPFSYQF